MRQILKALRSILVPTREDRKKTKQLYADLGIKFNNISVPRFRRFMDPVVECIRWGGGGLGGAGGRCPWSNRLDLGGSNWPRMGAMVPAALLLPDLLALAVSLQIGVRRRVWVRRGGYLRRHAEQAATGYAQGQARCRCAPLPRPHFPNRLCSLLPRSRPPSEGGAEEPEGGFYREMLEAEAQEPGRDPLQACPWGDQAGEGASRPAPPPPRQQQQQSAGEEGR